MWCVDIISIYANNKQNKAASPNPEKTCNGLGTMPDKAPESWPPHPPLCLCFFFFFLRLKLGSSACWSSGHAFSPCCKGCASTFSNDAVESGPPAELQWIHSSRNATKNMAHTSLWQLMMMCLEAWGFRQAMVWFPFLKVGHGEFIRYVLNGL